MIILILCIGGGFYYKLFVEIQKPPSRLLDVETEKITTIPQLGGELIFQINLVNFGEINMYDVLLRYSIFQGDNKVVISKEETVAISTTLQKVVKLNIPKTISAGQYILKVEAIYGNFTATSGFIFEIAAEEEVERIVKEVRKKYAVNDTNETKEEGEEVIKAVQNITEEIIKHSIKPVTIKPKKKVSPFEGMTRAQSHQLVKMISVREPDRAVKMCKIFEVDSNRYRCILEISRFKKDGKYCGEINITKNRDMCYMQVVMEIKSEGLCDKITDQNIKMSCESMTAVNSIQKMVGEGNDEGVYKIVDDFGMIATPLLNNTIAESKGGIVI